MSGFKLGARSLRNLEGVHPDLQAIVREAIKITEVDFTVIEGLRSVEKQKKLVAAGASQTMNSRHITGHAVDLAAMVGNEVRWDWPLYEVIADAMLKAAAKLDIPLTWGGSWTSLKDGPHFELPHKYYPVKQTKPMV